VTDWPNKLATHAHQTTVALASFISITITITIIAMLSQTLYCPSLLRKLQDNRHLTAARSSIEAKFVQVNSFCKFLYIYQSRRALFQKKDGFSPLVVRCCVSFNAVRFSRNDALFDGKGMQDLAKNRSVPSARMFPSINCRK
jgi:hypothetical protein